MTRPPCSGASGTRRSRSGSALAAHARDHGVDRIAFELHPLQLVYNVPTLQRMRDAVGPIIGANLDPSHLFWQQMDPLAVIRVLRDAVFHVHLKDTKPEPERLAIAGVLDQKLSTSYPDRAWNFRTLGVGHDRAFWEAFVQSLQAVGFDGVLSIENEDPYMEGEEGVREAAAFMRAAPRGGERGMTTAPTATGSRPHRLRQHRDGTSRGLGCASRRVRPGGGRRSDARTAGDRTNDGGAATERRVRRLPRR